MNNFLDLLATEPCLDVVCNGSHSQQPLLKPLTFPAEDTVSIDGIDVLPRFGYLCRHGKLTIDLPFYQWLHHATAQGWLLEPQI